jgi:hypothetical protein
MFYAKARIADRRKTRHGRTRSELKTIGIRAKKQYTSTHPTVTADGIGKICSIPAERDRPSLRRGASGAHPHVMSQET